MLPLPRFEYKAPRSLKEVIRILSDEKREAKVLAGGTDLFVQMKKGLDHPPVLVDIKSIPQLKKILVGPQEELVLGAGVTLAELEEWAKTREEWFGLSIAAGSIGSEQIRNRATVVGNVCRASPAADMIPVLIALDGFVQINGSNGARILPIENFIAGPGQTVLTRGEIVVSLKVPKPPLQTAAIYLKHGARKAMEIAIVAVAARLTFNRTTNKIECARVVLGSVAPTPIRVPEAEEILMKNGANHEVIEEVSKLAMTKAKPITDLRGTEGYRYEIVRVLTRRAVEQAWRQVRGSEVDRYE
jgi:carbon-monoxide dehydrogenase medium subunit